MTPAQEKVEKLGIELQETLDIDDLESKIYLNLLRTGPITASELAKDLNVDSLCRLLWKSVKPLEIA